VDIVAALLQRGANPVAKDRYEHTPIDDVWARINMHKKTGTAKYKRGRARRILQLLGATPLPPSPEPPEPDVGEGGISVSNSHADLSADAANQVAG
jgi:hypothetical protein